MQLKQMYQKTITKSKNIWLCLEMPNKPTKATNNNKMPVAIMPLDIKKPVGIILACFVYDPIVISVADIN